MQTRRMAGMLQCLVAVPSGSTTQGYRAIATLHQRRGQLVSHRYGPSDTTT
jgi:hypothetical protein